MCYSISRLEQMMSCILIATEQMFVSSFRYVKILIFNEWKRLDSLQKEDLPISWATTPLVQHPRPRLISWRRPVLPTCEVHLKIDKNAKFFLMFSFHLVHYTLIVSQSKTYDRKQSTGKMQAVGKVNLAST